MKNETAKREIESLDYYLQNHTDDYSEESHTAMMMAVKALEQEPSGDLISRNELLKAMDTWDKFGVDDTNSLFRLDNLSLPHYVPYIHYDDVVKCIKGMPSVKQEPKTDDFARWVAREIFDDMWEYNKDAFAEIACRKLAKLGIVIRMGDEWELVEQEPCETQMIDKSNFSQEQYKADLQCVYDCGKASVKPCEDAISRRAVEKITWEEPSYSDALNVLTEVRDKVRALPPVNPQPKTGYWILQPSNKEQGERDFIWWKCSECGQVIYSETEKDRREYHAFCGRCGAKMVEPQERSGEEC